MVDVSKASSIYAKCVAGEKLTPQEHKDLDEYASRFRQKEQNDC